ncbi:MAG: 16S rRNA (cytosine(1402)-N(4))-methyltransferase RsmH [Planctomycetota bacterium]
MASGGCNVSDERREHTPVLVDAVLDAFAAGEDPGALSGWVVDGTAGAGGHSRALLQAFPGVRLIALDRDPDALELARRTLAGFEERVTFVQGRLSGLEEILASAGVSRLAGLLVDLGVSSMQLDRGERGFSLQHDGPLDMRMGGDQRRTAADIVNRWDEADLADLLFHEGGERRSRRIAKAIVAARRRAPFLRTLALAEAIERAVGGRGGARVHPATRSFQALRRAVNEEGEELRRTLLLAEAELAPGGRLVTITFHSGEDGVVKRFLARGSREGRWRLWNKKPVEPTQGEVRRNPRARSARLRAAVRLNGCHAEGEA